MKIESDSKRLDGLLETLEEARKSLAHWQEQRTEALISLDSFAYDVKLIEEEKKQVIEEAKNTKAGFVEREKELNATINHLTDQLQELKLENETLNQGIQALDAQVEIEQAEAKKQIAISIQNLETALANAIAEQAKARENDLVQIKDLSSELENALNAKSAFEAQAKNAERECLMAQKKIIEITAKNKEFESKVTAERDHDLAKLKNLSAELQSLLTEKKKHEARAQKAENEILLLRKKYSQDLNTVTSERDTQVARARRAELELQSLRTQLNTLLHHSEQGLAFQVQAKAERRQPLKEVRESIEQNTVQVSDHIPDTTAEEINGYEIQEPDTEKPVPVMVQDYLKRLGY